MLPRLEPSLGEGGGEDVDGGVAFTVGDAHLREAFLRVGRLIGLLVHVLPHSLEYDRIPKCGA
ncbi:hypothetical protein GCM10017562_69960 [Streptomyces roseofulvus]